MSKLLPPLMGALDITLEQGNDLPISMTWKDENAAAIDLTNYSAIFQIRTAKDDKGAPLLEYTSPAEITLGGVAGTIDFNIADTDNQFGDDVLYWELQLIDGAGLKRPLVGGKATSIVQTVK